MKKLKCKICECEFVPEKENHYISRDEVKVGLYTLAGGMEEKIYDTFDCPQCGCQVIAQERKRSFYMDENIIKEENDCRDCKEYKDCPCGEDGHENGTSQGYSTGECKDFKLEEPEEEPEIEELEEEEETIPARPHKKRVPESEDEDKE